MKKILFVAAAALVSTGAFAQSFTKGDIFVKGTLSGLNFEYNSYDGDHTDSEFNVNLGGGYFFTEDLAADITLGFGMYKIKDVDADKSLKLGVAVRYNVYDNLYARLGYEGEKYTGSDLASYGRLGVGYDYFISEKVFANAEAFYRMGFGDVAEKNSTFGLEIGGGFRF